MGETRMGVETLHMPSICAWCGKKLRRGTGPVSHGICGRCSRAVEAGVVKRWPAMRAAQRPATGLTLPLPGFELGASPST